MTSEKTSKQRTEEEASTLTQEDQQVRNSQTSEGIQYNLSKMFRVHQCLPTLEYLASGETQDRPGPVLVQKSGHVDDDVQISALGAFYDMDGRKSRYIGKVLDWYRGEVAGDLKRSELNEG